MAGFSRLYGLTPKVFFNKHNKNDNYFKTLSLFFILFTIN